MIVHVGFPKTATTYLQQVVFPHLKGVDYYDFYHSSKCLQPLVYADPLDYQIDALQANLDLQDRALYSYENLTGSPFYYKGIGRSQVPLQLRQLGFKKVIMTVRPQLSAIDSYYRQFVQQGGTLSFKDFLDLSDKRVLPDKYFRLGYLKYDKLIHIYQDTFDKQNVLVLNMEDLVHNQEFFYAQLYSFLGVKRVETLAKKRANASLSNASLGLLRWVNRFTYSNVSPYHWLSPNIHTRYVWKIMAKVIDPYLLGWTGRRTFINKPTRAYLASYYEETNQALEALTGIVFANEPEGGIR